MPNVAFESYGYPRQTGNTGAINSEIGALFWPRVGRARFSVVEADAFKVTTLNGMDRGIRIEAGTAIGDAITDHLPTYDTLQFPAPVGASQWFLVVLRRNWVAPSSTNIVAIPGGTNTALPARSDTPGTQADQPIALCRVASGQTVVQEIIDLRCWASNGGLEAASPIALQYLESPGARVTVADRQWRYTNIRSGVWGWKSTVVDDTGYFRPIFFGNGFKEYYGNGYDGVVCRVVNGIMFISGAVINDNPLGWKDGAAMFRLDGVHIPQHKVKGTSCVADISGNFLPLTAGKVGETVSFSVSYPLALVEA